MTTAIHQDCQIDGWTLIEALENYADGNKAEHIRMLIGLREALTGLNPLRRFYGNAPDLLTAIERYIDDHAVKARVCPDCGGGLVTRTQMERVGECRGAPAYQEFGVDHCGDCTWEG